MEILAVDHLTRVFGAGEAAVTALDDVSLSIEAGEFIAIVGSSAVSYTHLRAHETA